MSVSSAMYSGISGLNANGEAMGVVGDNIANLNTTGFKYCAVHFEDLMPQTTSTGSGPAQVGRGTRIAEITPVWAQGSLETSADALDVAVTGTGFFMVNDTNTSVSYYTRDGNFSLDKDGYLINAHGHRVQGKAIDASTGTPSGSDTDIVINQNFSAPKVTENTEVVLNLNANASVGDTYSTAETIYDSQGNAHSLNLTYTKAAANTWTPSATLDGTYAVTITNHGGGAATDLTFNSYGTLTAGGSYDLALTTPPMSAAATVWLNMVNTTGGSTTQYAAASATNYVSQDGYGPGFLQRVSVDNDGIITGNYSNGQITPLYQFTLARFTAPNKLYREGTNLYSETEESGVPLTGAPGNNGLGKISANSLEQSNVDLANEFVHMILYQRAFQANSRIITTSDSMLEEVLALKR